MKIEEIIAVGKTANILKHLKRSGWTLAGADVTEAESVAAHSWGTAVLSLLISKYLKERGHEINTEIVLTLAILHDLPEALISDIPSPAIQRGGDDMLRGKMKAEKMAVEEILRPLGTVGEELIDLWKQIDGSSMESQIVQVADRLDMLIHTTVLQAGGVAEEVLLPFRDSVCKDRMSIESEDLRSIVNIICRMIDR